VSEISPLVSVAVVTYNQKDFLRECLESILAQDYKNIEIVVADDGSTDGTADMLREYELSGRGHFVLKISSVNKGITKNQNLAFFGCSGKYISWMAGDDLMLPGKISKQVDYLEKNSDCSICYHDLEIFESGSGVVLKKYSDVDVPREGTIGVLVKYGSFNGAVSNMVRRESAPALGFDERIPIASDWLYWVECLAGGGKIGYIPELLGRHRRHSNNVTSSSVKEPSLREIQDHLFSCDVLISRFPGLNSEIACRRAYLLRSLRWLNHGENYNNYLMASLSCRFDFRVFIGFLLSSLFSYRR